MAFSLIAGMTPDVAKEHIEAFGDDIANAVDADRDWFRKHPGRKWRVRPVAFGEFPDELLRCNCGRCRRVVVVHRITPKVRMRRVRTMDLMSALPATDAAIKARFGEVLPLPPTSPRNWKR
jgi:hypothetical protein